VLEILNSSLPDPTGNRSIFERRKLKGSMSRGDRLY
jgi:hypothetical protein